MVSLEAFSELLEVLYSAPLQQEQWERFLVLVSRHTESEYAAFLCANSRLGLSVFAQGGSSILDGVDMLAYKERFAPSDPFRAPVLQIGRPAVVQGEDLLPNEALLKTDLYRQLLAPQGYRYATLVLLSVTVRRLEVISIYRTFDQGPMDDDSNRLLNLLLPHIQKALEIRHVIGVVQQRLAGAEAMVDSSATATFLLTKQGRVLHRNTAAESLLRETNALALQEGTLIATEARFKEALRKLFQDAAVPVSPKWKAEPVHALALHRASGKKPLQLLASPLPPSHRDRSKADLVLLVTDPEKPLSFPDDVLHALYGLTPAQTEVANGLLTGYTLDEIATLRRVSLGTVRQQVKSILSRTGTSRQSDLIKLLMTLPQAASAN
jgi:DNA-binding CsgD family transcriptional regulator/PAS domain-containing protein